MTSRRILMGSVLSLFVSICVVLFVCNSIITLASLLGILIENKVLRKWVWPMLSKALLISINTKVVDVLGFSILTKLIEA